MTEPFKNKKCYAITPKSSTSVQKVERHIEHTELYHSIDVPDRLLILYNCLNRHFIYLTLLHGNTRDESNWSLQKGHENEKNVLEKSWNFLIPDLWEP